MNTVLLVVLLATTATAAVISNDMPDVVVLSDAADVDVNEGLEVLLSDVIEWTDVIDVADDTAIDTRCNLPVGTITGTRVYNGQYTANGVPGKRIVKDITVRTSPRCITKVRVTHIGPSQNATATIISGGVGSTFVTIRIRSVIGGGFNYRVAIYVK